MIFKLANVALEFRDETNEIYISSGLARFVIGKD